MKKKYLTFMVAAAALMTAACSDDDDKLTDDDTSQDETVDEGGSEEGTDGVFEEYDDHFVYHGETYQTVTLSDGSKWMAEPLRYLPEGLTPSADPTEESHVWFPYRLLGDADKITADGAEAMTDEASIRENGYLYDAYAAFGNREITEDNCYEFEGAQGICPEGWHIPTRAEFFSLCGLSNRAATGETGNQVNESALFYDETYGGGKVTAYNEAGWNYVFTGVRMQSNFNATPTYQLTTIWSGNASEETLATHKGEPALTYILSSTCYQPAYTDKEDPTKLTNIQFFAQMTTFSKTYPDGRVNVAYSSVKSGHQLRCVKDSE